MAKPKDVAVAIKDVIGEENIVSFTNCMTRLRVKANPVFDETKLKTIDGVLGLVKAGGDEFQIVLGPGFVNKVAAEFQKIVDVERTALINDGEALAADSKSLKDAANENKAKFRGKGRVQTFLSKISKVFSPLIPAFIGAGLLSGIAGILASVVNNNFVGHDTLKSWNTALSILLTILTNVFVIAVGWRMAEEWGGNPGLTAVVAALYASFVGGTLAGLFVPDANGGYDLLGIHISNIKTNWMSVGFVSLSYSGGETVATLGAPHAGLIGAMIAAGISIQFEKLLRKFMPGAIDTIVTPIIVLFVMLLANIFVIIPVAGYIFTGISWLFQHVYTNPFGAALLAGLFMIALVFGVHQGFLPIYFALIAETGVNGLFPIMAMGGTSQVGVALMMMILAGKGSVLRKQIAGAIIPGFLGIGEPLVYGISLPRVRPLVISCITATFGGFWLGACNAWMGLGVGMNAATGPGGLTAAIMMTTQSGSVVTGVLVYLSGVFLTYGLGMLFCWFGYSRIARHGSDRMKEIYKKENKNVKEKVLYTLAFITVIGIFVSWISWYAKLPVETKNEYKAYKLV